MTTNPTITTRRGLHPMLWIAAGAVTIFAVAGTAYLTGILPRHEAPAPVAAPQAISPAATQAPAAANGAAVGASGAPTNTTAVPAAATPAAPVTQAPATPVTKPKAAAPRHHAAATPRNEAPVASRGENARPEAPAPVICRDCGIVESTRSVAKEGEGSGLGAVAGGVVGGVLGNGVGQGTGRDLATIAGAIGGAVLGNKIEKNQRQTLTYHTTVRFEDGTSRIFITDQPSPWQPGDKVRVVDGRLTPR